MAERRTSSSRSGSTTKKATGARKRTAAAKKGGRTTSASKQEPELSGKSVADLRNALTRGIINPLNLVMLTRDRIEEVMDDAVSRGRVTADDDQTLAQDLINRGRKQTNDVLKDLDSLLGGARSTDAASRARRQVSEATARAR